MFNKFMFAVKDIIVCENKFVAKFMNNYFINITKTLNLKSSKILTVMDISS